MIKVKDTQICVKNLKMKRKRGQFFLIFWSGDSNPQIFSNFPASDFNFHGI